LDICPRQDIPNVRNLVVTINTTKSLYVHEGCSLFLKQYNINVIVYSLKQNFTLVIENLLLLGRLQSSKKGLEVIGNGVVIKQDSVLHTSFPISTLASKALDLAHKMRNLFVNRMVAEAHGGTELSEQDEILLQRVHDNVDVILLQE